VDLNVIQKINFIKMDEKMRKKKREKKMHVKEIMHGRMGESMGVGSSNNYPKKKRKKRKKGS
jgi:hypothetical protein